VAHLSGRTMPGLYQWLASLLPLSDRWISAPP
jgi:hypothetical protein